MNQDVFQRVFGRSSQLEDGQYMRTTFGAERIFFVLKEDGDIVLYAGEWFCNKIKKRFVINSPEQLFWFINATPGIMPKTILQSVLTFLTTT